MKNTHSSRSGLGARRGRCRAQGPTNQRSLKSAEEPRKRSRRTGPGYAVSVKSEPLYDGHGRRIEDVRVSVTDRCNFRCQYCMPAEGLAWLERDEILSFEEIERVVRLLVGRGIEAVRLPGGEPLVRRDFPVLASMLARLGGLRDLSLT